MARLIVGPFNRVEGDLEVRLDVQRGRVSSAQVTAPMYRGFEQMLVGRDPHDALVIVPRICGICSVSQSVAAARSLADAAGIVPTANGLLATNLMLATENLADHVTHAYLFFWPDFTRSAYAGRRWHAEATRRWAAQTGDHVRLAIAARQRWFTLLGTLGGKWPHTQSIEPGGSARAIEASERLRLLTKLHEFRAFLEATLYGAPLEAVAALDSEAALARWRLEAPDRGDLRLWLGIAESEGLDRLGRGPGRYLCHGAYAEPDGSGYAPPGLWLEAEGDSAARLEPLDLDQVREDSSHAWFADNEAARHPRDGLTRPDADKAGAYTWNKAPRYGGHVIETGAIARQLARGQPLIRDAVTRCGGTVYTRVLARLIELATVLPRMEDWLRQMQPGEPWCMTTPRLDAARGVGLAEAARGALGHWIRLERGRIAHWQIVAPTSWNFSPRDAAGTPGALESALVGVPVASGETTPIAVQHVVRSFDPCMVCTVH